MTLLTGTRRGSRHRTQAARPTRPAAPRSWPWRTHPPGDTSHIAATGGSCTVLRTAFYVGNGKNLPLWDRLPAAAYRLLLAIVTAPVIGRSIHHHRRPPVA